MIEQNSDLIYLIQQITYMCFMDGYLSSAGITREYEDRCNDEELKTIGVAKKLARKYSKMRKLS